MPLSPLLAKWLTQIGHDAVHASELGLATAPDRLILGRARQEQRTAITADLDYPQLLALSGGTEPSLILFRGGNWSDAAIIDRMQALLLSVTEEEIRSSIFVVESGRIRRRRLPVK